MCMYVRVRKGITINLIFINAKTFLCELLNLQYSVLPLSQGLSIPFLQGFDASSSSCAWCKGIALHFGIGTTYTTKSLFILGQLY